MVILIPENDDIRIPMALIDGKMPNIETAALAYHWYNQLGIADYKQDLRSQFHTFEGLSLLANSLEAKIYSKQVSSNLGQTLRNIQQYLIFHENAATEVTNASTNTVDNSTLGDVFKLLPDVSSPYYCVNLFADPFNSDSDRLKSYLCNWLAITQFKPIAKEEYADYHEFEKLCNNIFERINETYTDPIGKSLADLIAIEDSPLNGVRISP